MVYDIDGNKISNDSTGMSGLDGYVMETEPNWNVGSIILVSTAIGSTGEEGTGDENLRASDYIPVKGKNSLLIPLPVIINTDPAIFGLCFYDSNKNPLVNYGTNAFYGRATWDAYVKTAEVFVPENAAYFRTTYWSESYISSHSGIPDFTYEFTPGLYKASAITHEIPTNRGMLNAVRRARQLTDLVWTPRVNIPRYALLDADYSGQASYHFLDWCESGKTYKGAPYSGGGGPDRQIITVDTSTYAGQWGYIRMCLGIDVSFESFITAARYANSVMGIKKDQSTPDFDGSPYGTFCTGLVWYSLGGTHPISISRNFVSNNKLYGTVAASVASMNLNALRMCDVIQNSGHVAIITDLMRDENGNVTAVEVCEATTVGNGNNSIIGGEFDGLCRRRFWTADEFKSWYREYGIFRYQSITDIQYQKSDFVDTGDEPSFTKLIDMPCIPFLGNKATYHVGYIVNSKILIGATGFTDLVVTKDGAQFGQFAINGATEIEVGFSAAGSYSAYLKNGNDRTKSCEWTVV